MTDEERQRAIDFIVEQQALLSSNQLKREERTTQLERIVRLMISADWRTRRQSREMDDRLEQRFARLTDAVTTLADAQSRTEASIARTGRGLDTLIEVVREDREGKTYDP